MAKIGGKIRNEALGRQQQGLAEWLGISSLAELPSYQDFRRSRTFCINQALVEKNMDTASSKRTKKMAGMAPIKTWLKDGVVQNQRCYNCMDFCR